MIGVIGFAKVLLLDHLTQEDLFKDEDHLKIRVLREVKPHMFEIKFFILINDTFERDNLEDYVGVVHPNLNSKIRGLLTRVEISEIKKLPPESI